MSIDRIGAAFDRLRAAYVAADDAGIAAASEELEQLGQAQLALAALDPRKRAAIGDLAGGVRRYCVEARDQSFYKGLDAYARNDRPLEDVAFVLGLPLFIVESEVGRFVREAEATIAAARAELEARAEDCRRARMAERARLRSFVCPTCEAPSGAACRTASGRPRPNFHGPRVAAAKARGAA